MISAFRINLHCTGDTPYARVADDLMNAGILRRAVPPRECVSSGAHSRIEALTSENAGLDGEELVAAR